MPVMAWAGRLHWGGGAVAGVQCRTHEQDGGDAADRDAATGTSGLTPRPLIAENPAMNRGHSSRMDEWATHYKRAPLSCRLRLLC